MANASQDDFSGDSIELSGRQQKEVLSLKSPGQVSGRFLACSSQLVGLQGPIGGGKTTSCLVHLILNAIAQKPYNGLRRSRMVIVRDTYPNIHRNIYGSWHKLIPENEGKFRGGGDKAGSHRFGFKHPQDGTMIDCVVHFLALGKSGKIESILKGFEFTSLFANEADELPEDTLDYCVTRLGRFPSQREGGPTVPQILFDLNAPTVGSHLHHFQKRAKESKDIDYFIQPSGLDQKAENLENLPGGADYYTEKAKILKGWMADKYIRNISVYHQTGQPVFPEFLSADHISNEKLEPSIENPLLVGLDTGRNPAAVVIEVMPNGQKRVIDCIFRANRPINVKDFAQEFKLRRALAFRDNRIQWAFADPAGKEERALDDDAVTFYSLFGKATGLELIEGPTQNVDERLYSIKDRLRTKLENGEPSIIFSKHLTFLNQGLSSGYVYAKIDPSKPVGTERPVKNAFSHPIDALQYALTGFDYYEDTHLGNVPMKKRVALSYA